MSSTASNGTIDNERSSIFGIIQKAAAIVTAFITLAGVAYATFDHFATKKEVNQLRCQMDANIEFVKSKQKAAELSDVIQNNVKERRALERQRGLTDDQKLVVANLESYGKGLAEQLKKAILEAEESAKKLEKQECSR